MQMTLYGPLVIVVLLTPSLRLQGPLGSMRTAGHASMLWQRALLKSAVCGKRWLVADAIPHALCLVSALNPFLVQLCKRRALRVVSGASPMARAAGTKMQRQRRSVSSMPMAKSSVTVCSGKPSTSCQASALIMKLVPVQEMSPSTCTAPHAQPTQAMS